METFVPLLKLCLNIKIASIKLHSVVHYYIVCCIGLEEI